MKESGVGATPRLFLPRVCKCCAGYYPECNALIPCWLLQGTIMSLKVHER